MNDAKHSLRCVRCEGELIEGCMVTPGMALFGKGQTQRWVEGDIQHTSLGIRSSEGVIYLVKTWRCAACGNIESFAHERVY